MFPVYDDAPTVITVEFKYSPQISINRKINVYFADYFADYNVS